MNRMGGRVREPLVGFAPAEQVPDVIRITEEGPSLP